MKMEFQLILINSIIETKKLSNEFFQFYFKEKEKNLYNQILLQ